MKRRHPAGTPEPIVMRLNVAFNEAMSDPTTRPSAHRARLRPGRRGTAAYAVMLESELAEWRKVIKESNIPPPS